MHSAVNRTVTIFSQFRLIGRLATGSLVVIQVSDGDVTGADAPINDKEGTVWTVTSASGRLQ